MKFRIFILLSYLVLLFIKPGPSLAGPVENRVELQTSEDSTEWHDAQQFNILGQAWSDLKHPYDRLPASAEQNVRLPLWKLSTHSAGLAIYFSSNSTCIQVKWTVRYNNEMAHMAATGIKGVDLYAWHEGKWQFVNNGRPSGKSNRSNLISGMDQEWREYLLYLPLYDGIDTLKIGIDQGSGIRSPEVNRFSDKPIVFYGTSITQGGCATRPGMAYTSIVERKLGREVINLGFSGNGRMEMELAKLISEIDASCYIIDCLPNLDSSQVADRTIPFVEFLKDAQPDIPILLVESPIPEQAFLNEAWRVNVEAKNRNLFSSFQQLQRQGIDDIYYVQWEKLLGYDHEATVDGVHYTDLGFQRYAERIIQYLEGILE